MIINILALLSFLLKNYLTTGECTVQCYNIDEFRSLIQERSKGAYGLQHALVYIDFDNFNFEYI